MTRYVQHKPRANEEIFTDKTAWLVVEESPSFYICFAEGEGFCMKLKRDYVEVKMNLEMEPAYLQSMA